MMPVGMRCGASPALLSEDTKAEHDAAAEVGDAPCQQRGGELVAAGNCCFGIGALAAALATSPAVVHGGDKITGCGDCVGGAAEATVAGVTSNGEIRGRAKGRALAIISCFFARCRVSSASRVEAAVEVRGGGGPGR